MKILVSLLAVVALAAGLSTSSAQASDYTRSVTLNRTGVQLTQQMISTIDRYGARPCYAYRLIKPKVARLGGLLSEMRYLGYPNRAAERKYRALRGLGRQMEAIC